MSAIEKDGRQVVVTLLLLGAALAASAADGRIPIYQTTTITQPGSYYLTQDFDAGGGTGVSIQANNVTLDLGGHTISGTGNIVYGANYTNIRVTNGTLIGGFYSCFLSCSGGRFRVDHLTILNSTGYGIYLLGDSTPAAVTVEDDLIVASSALYGISLAYVGAGRVARCTVRGTTGSGPSAGVGLYMSSCTGMIVEDNAFVANYNHGITLSGCTACTVSHNTISGTVASYGIWLTGTSLGNSVDWNTISEGVSSWGLVVDSGSNYNEYSYNRSRSNPAGAYSIGGTGNTDGGGNN